MRLTGGFLVEPTLRAVAVLVGAVVMLSCTSGTKAPAQAVKSPLLGPSCRGDDHSIDDGQLGWGFCYPSSWRYRERTQQVQAPQGVDTTFDVTDVSCLRWSTPTPPNPPECLDRTPDTGKFGFMVVGTYQLKGASSLNDWIGKEAPTETALEPLAWGNARQAVRSGSGRRFALTEHQIVELDIRAGIGNLDLDSLMNARLASWRFQY